MDIKKIYEKNFESAIYKMEQNGIKTIRKQAIISIPNAEEIFHSAMSYFLGLNGDEYIRLKEYDTVVKWLSNNDGRGLFITGTGGRGKSTIARVVIPAILLEYCNRVVNVCDKENINVDIDIKLKKKFMTLDDIGLESEANIYGNKRMAVVEYLDNAEKNGNILIITTNLNEKELFEKYGARGLERIVATTVRMKTEGESFRK